MDAVLTYAAKIKQERGYEMRTMSIGGGIGVRYTLDKVPPPFTYFADGITSHLKSKCGELNLNPPRLILEPGRRIVARAGITLYTVGVIKEIPGIRTYVSVDGGISDNIRFAMYGDFARQEGVVANKVSGQNTAKYRITGKLCESGDILADEVELPELATGDILAMSGSGAYAIPMQSNYNSMLRPAIVFVRDGKARLIRRRETIDDLTRRDVI
jgi:diaminopimelate decarboxylase